VVDSLTPQHVDGFGAVSLSQYLQSVTIAGSSTIAVQQVQGRSLGALLGLGPNTGHAKNFYKSLIPTRSSMG